MVFGDSAEQGVIRGSYFLHEPMGFALTAPPGWKYQNTPAALLVASPQGDAGVVMQSATGAGGSDEEIVRKVLNAQSGRLERTTINGIPATHFSGSGLNRQGQAVPIDATLINFNKQQLLLRQLFKDAGALNRSQEGARSVIASFRPISSEERKLARPFVIRTLPQPQARSFAAIAKDSPLESNAEPRLRLLNGLYPSGEPAAGRPIKVVGR
jgi:predicted Zn-dependent protease